MHVRAAFLCAFFVATSSPSFAADTLLTGFASDLTPGYQCEISVVAGTSIDFPVINFKLDCTHEITETKARELVGTLTQTFFGQSTFSVWDEAPPKEQSFCPLQVEWSILAAPLGFSIEL